MQTHNQVALTPMDVVRQTFDEMPDMFTSYEFGKQLVKNGFRFRFAGMNKFLKRHAHNSKEMPYTWKKKGSGGEQIPRDIVNKTFAEMPDIFTSHEFSKQLVHNGFRSRFAGMKEFLKRHAHNNKDMPKTWKKKGSGGEQTPWDVLKKTFDEMADIFTTYKFNQQLIRNGIPSNIAYDWEASRQFLKRHAHNSKEMPSTWKKNIGGNMIDSLLEPETEERLKYRLYFYFENEEIATREITLHLPKRMIVNATIDNYIMDNLTFDWEEL